MGALLVGCESGAGEPWVEPVAFEAAAPNSPIDVWQVSGKLTSADVWAGEIVALGSSGDAVMGLISVDGEVALELPAGDAYTLHFMNGDETAGIAFFDGGLGSALTAALSLPSLAGKPGGGGLMGALGQAKAALVTDPIVDLGSITLAGGVARTSNNPLKVLDRDRDGLSDFDDFDDDGDGALDTFDPSQSLPFEELPFIPVGIAPTETSQVYFDTGRSAWIVYTRFLDEASVAEAVSVTVDGEAVPFEWSFGYTGQHLLVEPAESVPGGTEVTIVISDALVSTDGDRVSSDVTHTYRLPEDPEPGGPFRVEVVLPYDGQSELACDTPVLIEFTRAPSPDSHIAGPGFFSLSPEGSDYQVPIAFEPFDHFVAFRPLEQLEPLTAYRVSVGSDVFDGAGEPLVAPWEGVFTTDDGSGKSPF